MAGRKPNHPALTQEIADALVSTLQKYGLFDNQIAILNNVAPYTLEYWLKVGLRENAAEPYRSFAERYTKAKIIDEGENLIKIKEASDPQPQGMKPGDFRARAWYLERRYPKRWNPAFVPPTGPSEDIDPEALLKQLDEQHDNLVDLIRNAPPELQEAMVEAREDIMKFFDGLDKVQKIDKPKDQTS